ncbi:hypothetical protein ASF78_20030 [Cellulomonas sp. Leaf334]|nr:hypothetical protein ASF78_20030 [Cellulomonas sp. Leaf334]
MIEHAIPRIIGPYYRHGQGIGCRALQNGRHARHGNGSRQTRVGSKPARELDFDHGHLASQLVDDPLFDGESVEFGEPLERLGSQRKSDRAPRAMLDSASEHVPMLNRVGFRYMIERRMR